MNKTDLIVKYRNKGLGLGDLTRVLEISRQAVAQAFEIRTGEKFGALLKSRPQKILYRGNYVYCAQCGTKNRKYKNRRFCNKNCKLKFFTYDHLFVVCYFCNTKFNPLRNKRLYVKTKKDPKYFCSRKHYQLHRKTVSELKKEYEKLRS